MIGNRMIRSVVGLFINYVCSWGDEVGSVVGKPDAV